jgi:hypothetical protein
MRGSCSNTPIQVAAVSSRLRLRLMEKRAKEHAACWQDRCADAVLRCVSYNFES